MFNSIQALYLYFIVLMSSLSIIVYHFYSFFNIIQLRNMGPSLKIIKYPFKNYHSLFLIISILN